MKVKTLLIILSVITITNTLNLRRDQTSVNAKDVKSPGSFDNVAPDAKRVINPAVSRPKVDVNLNVSSTGLVQRSDYLGTTPVPGVASAIDPSSGTFGNVPTRENRKIIGTSTTWAPTNTLTKVSVDMETGKAIPQPNNANQPVKKHGTDSPANNK